MKTIEVEVTGISPILMHRFPMEPVEGIEKKSPEEQAERAAYRRRDTKSLYVPAVNVQRALVSAASYSKGKGRSNLSRIAAACLLVSPEYLDLGTRDYQVDAQSVVIAATKGRIIRYRPRLNRWKFTFTLDYDETLMSPDQVRRIVDDAGMRVGILDFRPEKRGSFGRFSVTSWKPSVNGA